MFVAFVIAFGRYSNALPVRCFPQARRLRFHEKVARVKHPNQKVSNFLKSVFILMTPYRNQRMIRLPCRSSPCFHPHSM
jgi:hypothetical protein